MKIAIVVEGFSNTTETFIYQHAKALVNNGCEVIVITFQRYNIAERPYDHVITLSRPSKYHPLFYVKYNPIWLVRRLIKKILGGTTQIAYYDLYKIYYRKQLKRILESVNPDVINAQFGPMGWLVNPVSKKLGIPLITSFHGYDATMLPLDKKWLKRYLWLWSSKNIVTTPSKYIRDNLIKLGADKRNVIVVHNGISLEKWKYSNPYNRFDGRLIKYLFVGRLVEKKGPIQLLEAFNECRILLGSTYSPCLIIAGDGPLMKTVKERVDSLQLNKFVQLLGSCSNEQVNNLMHKAHVYVQHSVETKHGDKEGLPVSIVEATACGLPVVSTKHSGIPEIVIDHKTGFLVEEGNVGKMAERMAYLCKNPELWSDFSNNGRSLVEKEYEINNVTCKFLNIVSNLVSTHR